MFRIFDDLDGLSAGAADLFLHEAQAACRAKGRFTVALAGGRTPKGAYKRMAEPPLDDRIPWPQVEIFWGDERCVSPEDPRHNARMAKDVLLDRVSVPDHRIHPIQCHRDPTAAAGEYEALLQRFFPGNTGFDLVLLGLGEDGHTASLFPGSPVLRDMSRRAVAVQRAGEDFCRVTLTAAFINCSALVVFLVSGSNKAAAVKQALQGGSDSDPLPAQLISPVSGRTLWLLDREAAGAFSSDLKLS